METSIGHNDAVFVSRDRLLACEYAYDATGLLARVAVPGQTGERFWRGTHTANELRTSASGDTQLTWLRAVGQPIVEQVSGTIARMTLLATAISGSVLLEADTAVRAVTYAPHGSRPDGEQAVGTAEAQPAFNGELLDAASGCYLLGAGHHRPYSPTLGIFLAADALSPFGAGGLNSYAYCAGDPVNRSDPTGHFWKWIVAAVGIAVGVAAVAVTFGAASKAVAAVATVGFSALTKSTAGAIASTTLGVVAVGAEVGAIAAEVSGDRKTATILGFVGLALGIVAAAPAIAKAAAKGAAKFSRFTKRISTIRTQGLSGRGAGRAAANMAQELSPTSARRAAVQRMIQGSFRNPLARRAAPDQMVAQQSSVLRQDLVARLRQAESSGFIRRSRTTARIPDEQFSSLDQTNPSNWTIRQVGGGGDSGFASSNINVNEAGHRTGLSRRAFRRLRGERPPTYDQATLPTYDEAMRSNELLPPPYDSHGFP